MVKILKDILLFFICSQFSSHLRSQELLTEDDSINLKQECVYHNYKHKIFMTTHIFVRLLAQQCRKCCKHNNQASSNFSCNTWVRYSGRTCLIYILPGSATETILPFSPMATKYLSIPMEAEDAMSHIPTHNLASSHLRQLSPNTR